ncbi:hypothetical protein [Enterococcus faecalis]|uniref:hypothetical protein n=1 Tax=Enterococcus faecalis TaxID=1351 RepID=UPI000353522B|nr:hypothetical protein [Enterococcus faecalis]EPH86359.1 hypothetical protein D924_00612 [Enterococcus faecalis 06-MB-S-10]EPH86686.1 hypothetical protein D927_00010 [Enterococcus faecalis 02-MB-BW-10]EPH91475.1 hypothetical protein D923_00878 [Enterococcus faecalis 06-MB-S-04]
MEERVRFEAKFVPGKHDVAMKYFAKQLEEKKGKTKADILQDLCVELNELRNELDSMQCLRESIIADIKKELDPIRIRTGYVDKNVRVLMDIENGRLIKEGISSLGGMNDLVAKPMKQSIQRVTDEIAAYRMKKVEREQKNTNINPGGHE